MNKLSERHTERDLNDFLEDLKKYIIICPCCGTALHFSKDDVYKDEDNCCIHHEYIDCIECNEKIQLSDDEYFGY